MQSFILRIVSGAIFQECLTHPHTHACCPLNPHPSQAGGSGYEAGGGHRPEDEEDLFPYFSAGCFSGYGEGAKVKPPRGGGRRKEGGRRRATRQCWLRGET